VHVVWTLLWLVEVGMEDCGGVTSTVRQRNF
jgi:hypothetical protein